MPARTLQDVIRRAVETAAADLHVSIPARILKVNRDGSSVRSVEVQPLIREAGADVAEPPIVEVPVHFLGAGSFRITVPVRVGDDCLLVFSDRSLDRWFFIGGDVDPIDPRQHALTDAVAIPGLRDASELWSNADDDGLTIGHDGSGPRAKFTDSEIVLDGGGASVARVGDRTAGHSHEFSLSIPGVGTVVGAIASSTDTMAEGAARVKA